MDLPPLSPEAKIVIASFAGGMIRLFLKPARSLLKSVWAIACCVICGYYFTPPTVMYFGLEDQWAGAVGALIGLVGLSIADALVNFNYGKAFEAAAEKYTDRRG